MAKKSIKKPIPVQNPVAKFAHHFNNAVFFRDRTAYSRKNKHKGIEPFSLYCLVSMAVYRERFVRLFAAI